MNTAVIGSRYRLGAVVTCTPESTTWDARDTWLDERVLVVTPEPGCDERFAALASAVLDRSSAHLVGLYDIGATTDDFVVFGVPAATLSDERAPARGGGRAGRGRALGDALEALHERGDRPRRPPPGFRRRGGIGRCGAVAVAAGAPPTELERSGRFRHGPGRALATCFDRGTTCAPSVRCLLGALAGTSVLSSEQVENLERELAGARAECGDHRRPRADAAGAWRLRRGGRAARRLRGGAGGPAGGGHVAPICRRCRVPPRRRRRRRAVEGAVPRVFAGQLEAPRCSPASGSPDRSASARTARAARSPRTRPAASFVRAPRHSRSAIAPGSVAPTAAPAAAVPARSRRPPRRGLVGQRLPALDCYGLHLDAVDERDRGTNPPASTTTSPPEHDDIEQPEHPPRPRTARPRPRAQPPRADDDEHGASTATTTSTSSNEVQAGRRRERPVVGSRPGRRVDGSGH